MYHAPTASDDPIYTPDEVAALYNEGLDEDDFRIFAYYRQQIGDPLSGWWEQHNGHSQDEIKSWVLQGKLFYFKKQLLPRYIYLAENIYDRQAQLDADQATITEKYGQATADRQRKVLGEVFQQHYAKRLLLNKNLPASERLQIDLLSKFCQEFSVAAIVPADEFNIKAVTASKDNRAGRPDFTKDHQTHDHARKKFPTLSIVEAFQYWLVKHTERTTGAGVDVMDIINVHINRRSRPKEVSPTVWSALKAKCKGEADRMFTEFLSDVLLTEDQSKIETTWNRQYNGYVAVDFTQVPIALSMARTYRDMQVDIRPEKRDAVAFMSLTGSGCLAYEVGFGKAQPLDAKVLTPTGWTTMGSLHVGSKIIGANGKQTEVTQIHPQGKKQIYRVCFSDGSHTEACGEHLWKVQTINHRGKYKDSFYIKTTDEIAQGVQNGRGNYQYSIPMVEAVNFEPRSLPIHPYLMGVLIGDGTFRKDEVLLSTKDLQVLDFVDETLPVAMSIKKCSGDKYDYRLIRKRNKKGLFGQYNNPLVTEIRDFGLIEKKSHEKFVPEDYKFSSVEDRLAVLQGLMDTDGTVGKRKTGSHISFTTVSPQLAEDVKFLVQSLGGTTSLYVRRPTYTYEGEKRQGRISYTITLQLPPDIIPFRLAAKVDKFKPRTKYMPVRYITEVFPMEEKEAQCISVAAKDHLYVTDDFIVTHNTWGACFAMSYVLDSDQAKRPLLVVPNQVYKQFISELEGLLPHRRILKYYNLSEAYLAYAETYPPQEGDITVMTYEGFRQVGFNEDTSSELLEELYEVLNQGIDDQKAKQKQGFMEGLEGWIGQGLRGTKITIEEYGWDFLCVDEAHNMKKIFTSVVGDIKDGKRERHQYQLSSGSRSTLGTKGFLLAQYIMRNNNKRNVMLLTATPFTNSPLEVYSMLSMVAYQALEKMDLKNVKAFFDHFVNTEYKLVINAKYEPQRRQIVTGFRNLTSLQAIIYRFMDRKDGNTVNANGEKVNIKRPNKWVLPLKTKTVDGNTIALNEDERVSRSCRFRPCRMRLWPR